MINIQNGEVILENILFSLNSNTQREIFADTFPNELIRDINDVKTGYIWYYIWGSIANKDEMILLALCFNPMSKLEYLEILPYVFQNTINDDFDWSKERLLLNKTLCDDWLKTNYNLKDRNTFNWGSISSTTDERSWSSCIYIRYL